MERRERYEYQNQKRTIKTALMIYEQKSIVRSRVLQAR